MVTIKEKYVEFDDDFAEEVIVLQKKINDEDGNIIDRFWAIKKTHRVDINLSTKQQYD